MLHYVQHDKAFSMTNYVQHDNKFRFDLLITYVLAGWFVMLNVVKHLQKVKQHRTRFLFPSDNKVMR